MFGLLLESCAGAVRLKSYSYQAREARSLRFSDVQTVGLNHAGENIVHVLLGLLGCIKFFMASFTSGLFLSTVSAYFMFNPTGS